MDFRILGPLEVRDQGREPAIAAGKQRALLAILLLHANEVVSSDRLIEELWGERPPGSAAKSLQVHVSRLRHALERGDGNGADSVVVTRGGGYLIRVGPGELDLERFERLLEEGSGALADGASERALELLREALALWRGPPLAEFAYEPFAQQEIARLEELHLSALELRIEAALALGEHARLIGELETLVKRHPFRERLRAQLMLALYRSGRQAEALQAYQQARRTLVEELGIEPSRELEELQRAILAQDPSLERPRSAATTLPAREHEAGSREPQPVDVSAPTHGRWVLGAAGLLLAGLVLAGLVLLLTGDPEGDGGAAPLTNDSHAVAAIDPSANKVTEALSVGARPGAIAFDPESGSLWVANLDDQTVTRIDPQRRRVGRTVAIGDTPGGPLEGGPKGSARLGGLAAGGGAAWVASANGTDPFVSVWRIDARFETREQTARVATSPFSSVDIALSPDALWVAPSWGLLRRIDPRTGSVQKAPIDPGHDPSAVAADADSAWVADTDGNTVTRIDAASGLVTTIPVGNGPAGIGLGAGGVWVALRLDDALIRIDPETGSVTKTIPVGRAPAGLAVGAGAVWVANSGDGTVSRIDPQTDEVVATIPVGASPQDVAVARRRVWVSVRPKTLMPSTVAHGTLRVEGEQLRSLDPALAFGPIDSRLAYATGARLLNYPDAPSPAGSRLVPEVAQSLPTRSKDRRTYTFTIRKGFRFSPPSGEPVTARTFKYTIERTLSPKMDSPWAPFVTDIVGGSAYAEGRASHLAGVTARGNTLRIRLTRRAGDFPARISMPAFAAVPTDTPIDPDGLREVPSAGPYYVASNEPGEGVVLKRNPNYHGGRPRRLREIRLTVGTGWAQAAAHAEAGGADYVPMVEGASVPPNATRLARRYGPGSRAAEAGRQRYFVNPFLSLDRLSLNTSRPLFASARMRQAVNYAIDRRALTQQGGLNFAFPSIPTDQYLPPGMPGFTDARIYPSRPNLETARRLAGEGRRTAVLYAPDGQQPTRLAEIVKANLKAIGIDVQIKLIPLVRLFQRISKKGEPYDIAMTTGWFADYADPANFLSQLDGRALDPRSPLSAFSNDAYFDDPEFNRRLAAAGRLTGPSRYIAYSRLDADMAREGAPWAAFGNETEHDFFSARIGCQLYQPLYGVDLGALCIRD